MEDEETEFFVALLLMTLVANAYLGALPAKRETIMGEVVDIVSYATKGAHGEEHSEVIRFRAEGGFPMGILTEVGTLYVAVYRNPAPAASLEAANKILAPLAGLQVVCQGRVYERDGVKVVEIAVVSEM